MPDDTNAEESYEDWTVAELKDELTARDLHTSGNKDELIARLEENDAAEAEETSTEQEEPQEASKDLVATEQEEADENPDPAKRIYSPYELPANSAAAQAFMDAHPDAVDPELTLDPPERHEMALANIQDHVDQMSELGVTVEDPRLEGYTPPEPPVEPPPEEITEPPPEEITEPA